MGQSGCLSDLVQALAAGVFYDERYFNKPRSASQPTLRQIAINDRPWRTGVEIAGKLPHAGSPLATFTRVKKRPER